MSKKNKGLLSFQMKVVNQRTDKPTDIEKETKYTVFLKPIKDKTALTSISGISVKSTNESIFSMFPDKQLIDIQFAVSQKSLSDFQKEKEEENEKEAEESEEKE